MGRKRTKEPVSLKAAKLGARITRAREKRGFKTTYALEEYSAQKKTKVSHQTISNYETGQHDPDDPRSHRTISLLANLLQDTFGLSSVKLDSDSTQTIRIEAYVAAGQPIDDIIEGEAVAIDPAFIKTPGDITALRVRGDSMIEHHILDGDVLICRRTPEPHDGSVVVVDFREQIGASVKFWKRKGDTVLLASDRYPQKGDPVMVFPARKLGKVYEIVGLIRSLK